LGICNRSYRQRLYVSRLHLQEFIHNDQNLAIGAFPLKSVPQHAFGLEEFVVDSILSLIVRIEFLH
jgi:hypothetical protein